MPRLLLYFLSYYFKIIIFLIFFFSAIFHSIFKKDFITALPQMIMLVFLFKKLGPVSR